MRSTDLGTNTAFVTGTYSYYLNARVRDVATSRVGKVTEVSGGALRVTWDSGYLSTQYFRQDLRDGALALISVDPYFSGLA